MKKQFFWIRSVIMLCAGMATGVHADSWDPGDDSVLTATPLTNILETIQQHGPHDTTNLTDFEDWFSIEMDAGSIYHFESMGPSDMEGTLFNDTSGTIVAHNDDIDFGNNVNFRIIYTAVTAGTYYLKVNQLVGSSSEYSLSYYKELLPTDSWDPMDDTGAGATLLPIDSNLSTNGPHVLTIVDTNDWFRFSLVAGETYRFETMLDDPAEQDTFGMLYSDSNGTVEVASNDDDGEFDNFLIIYTPPVSGDYYLKVEELNGDPANYSLKYIQVPGDLDGDGMNDTWEIAYFGSTNAMPDAFGDADSFNNLAEFIAGTDPTNAASYFAVTNWSTGSFILEWPTLPDRLYSVLWTTNLPDGFTTLTNGIEHPQNSYTDTDTVHTTESEGFYKVNVQLK